jgi:hypothetical protein
MRHGRVGILVAGALALLVLRTAYGLVAEFWFPDELQIYLLGLKYSTTGLWPYLGPDVVYTRSQIPGALQGLLVGLPLRLWGVPEAPAIFLNVLSFAALAFLAWYATRRFPGVPAWFTWGWTLTCPWAMVYSTRVVNPSYVLPFAIVFMVAAYEALEIFRDRVLGGPLLFFLQGVATTCILQLHMSWVLLPPITSIAVWLCWRRSGPAAASRAVGAWAGGMLLGAATLVPTFVWWADAATGGVERNLVFRLANLFDPVTVLVRFLGFGSFEVPYMIGANTRARIGFVKDHLWVAPFVVALLVGGFAQIAYFAWCLFRRGSEAWNRARLFTSGSILLVWLAFFFSVKGPSSHTFYLMFPVALLFSFLCTERLLQGRPRLAIALAAMLACGAVFHLALAVDNLEKRSLYRDRARVVRAIEASDHRVLGERRADEWGYGY